jgi:hypothetical protein
MPCFYAVRIRIRMQHAAVILNTADVPAMVLDVKGDLWVPVTVPIVNFRGWNDKTIIDLTSYFIIEQLGPIVGAPSPSTSVVYVNIFRAGGEDMQFALPADPAIHLNEKSRILRHDEDLKDAIEQCSINEKFKQIFEPIAEGQFFREEEHSVMAEDVKNVIDLLKRPADYPITSLNLFGVTTNVTIHSLIMSSFMWQRGSRVIRNLYRSNTTTLQDGIFLELGRAAGRTEDGFVPATSAPTNAPLYQTVAANLPWLCATPYTCTYAASTKVLGSSQRAVPVNIKMNVAGNPTFTQAAGDDWVFMYQVPWAIDLVTPQPKAKNISLLDRAMEKHGPPKSLTVTTN